MQVKPDELKLYSSVKNIGQKEKRKPREDVIDGDLIQQSADGEEKSLRTVNSIAGSKRKRKTSQSEQSNEESSELDTDAMSTDSEIDETEIQAALDRFKKSQEADQEKALKKKYAEYKTDKIESDEEMDKVDETRAKRKTKYIHVERREEIKV